MIDDHQADFYGQIGDRQCCRAISPGSCRLGSRSQSILTESGEIIERRIRTRREPFAAVLAARIFGPLFLAGEFVLLWVWRRRRSSRRAVRSGSLP
jgi:hypothetical protein